MRISRRAAVSVAAVLTGLATLGAAGAALASSSAPRANNRVQVLRLRADLVDAAGNDAGHGGPADIFGALFDIRTRSGAEAGKESVSCIAIPRHWQLCHGGFALKGGQIEAQLVVRESATRFTAAITGGTGIYEGVTGQIRNVQSASGPIFLTFYLIRPHHH